MTLLPEESVSIATCPTLTVESSEIMIPEEPAIAEIVLFPMAAMPRYYH
jgi:hypothetical protein